jgi:hypothetical protein
MLTTAFVLIWMAIAIGATRGVVTPSQVWTLFNIWPLFNSDPVTFIISVCVGVVAVAVAYKFIGWLWGK